MKVRAPHTLIVLATLLAGPALHAQEEDAGALRDNADAVRATAEQAFIKKSAACYDKFFVNACLDKARQERTRAVIEARKLEARANRIARAKRVEAMEKRLRACSCHHRRRRRPTDQRRRTHPHPRPTPRAPHRPRAADRRPWRLSGVHDHAHVGVEWRRPRRGFDALPRQGVSS